jgi:MFS family permease
MTSPVDAAPAPPPPGAGPAVPPDVLKLGVVSLLTDLSSEMIFAVFAVFFTTVAGGSSALLGLVEGLADFSSAALTWISGRMSDTSGRRKPFAIAGYAFSTLAKGLLVVSSAVAPLAVFRVVERLGKGFRGPPRDAWLSGIATKAARGYAFGVHQALDKAGAVLGPLAAWGLLRVYGETAGTYHLLFMVALVPAVLSVLVLGLVRDRPAPPQPWRAPADAAPAATPALKRFLVPAGVFALGYYSLGFLLLKAHAVGIDMPGVVLLYALFNATCVAVAPFAGRLGDRIGRARVVMMGYALYAGVNVMAAFADGAPMLVAAFAVYGVFYAIDESQARAFVVDLAPARRASATGIYQSVTGVLYVGASLVAGALWQRSTVAPFVVAAGLAVLAIAVFVVTRPVPAPADRDT